MQLQKRSIVSGYRPTAVCALDPEGTGQCRRCDSKVKLDSEALALLADGGYTVCRPCMNIIIQAHPQAVQLSSTPS